MNKEYNVVANIETLVTLQVDAKNEIEAEDVAYRHCQELYPGTEVNIMEIVEDGDTSYLCGDAIN